MSVWKALPACSAMACALVLASACDSKPTPAASTPAAKPTAAPPAAATAMSAEEQAIQSAVSAAPPALGAKAEVVTMAADGAMKEVRPGTNGFWCMPDNPTTPGPDPMCGDANSMEWMHALVEHKAPAAGKVGFIYMLAGGTDASNTDPYAQQPTAGNNWIETGPHVMIVGAKDMMAGYPRTPAPDTSSPYVMWPDTPYEHLMIPVK